MARGTKLHRVILKASFARNDQHQELSVRVHSHFANSKSSGEAAVTSIPITLRAHRPARIGLVVNRYLG